MEHPLKVYIPGKGVAFLLHYWTHNEQDCLALQSSESGLMRAAKNLMRKHSDIRFKGVYEVELVAPSNAMCLKAIADERADIIKDFMNSVCYAIHNIWKAEHALPAQFLRCDTYAPAYINKDGMLVDSERDEAPSSYAVEWHPDCRHCTHGFKLVGFTDETLYEKFSESWYKIYPIKVYPNSKYFYSQADQAADDEAIWAAVIGGGFSSGAELRQLKPGSYGSFGAFFYYRLLRTLEMEPYEEEHKQFKVLKKAEAKEKEKLWTLKKERDANEAIEKTMMVFQETP